MSRALLWCLLLVASALVALLGYQLSEVRGHLTDAYSSASHPQVGSWVPTYATRSLTGSPLVLAPSGVGQVLYFFTPECPYCQQSAPEVRELHTQLQPKVGSRFEFIGVGGGNARLLADEARKRGFEFPIAQMTPKLAHLFKARQVPLLLVVGPDGQVIYSKVGVFKNKDDARPLMAALARTDAKFLAN